MWETHYASAQAYCAEHGNLSIPVTYRDEFGYLLGKWLKTQRANKEILTGQQIQRLNDIGMEW